MDEYIKREEAIEVVKHAWAKGLEPSQYIEIIPAADVAPVQEWISVDDRLPEPEQDVILCTREIETYGKHHEKKKIYRNIFMGYFDGDEWLTSYCYGCEYIFRMNEKYPNETIEVTHWMPMPELPKGE